MASKKIEAVIKGSIVSPEAAQAVINALDAGEKVVSAGEVAPVADPATADAEAVAIALNALIAALKG